MRSRLPSRLLTACLVAALGGTLALPSASAVTRHPDRRAETRASAPVSARAAAKATLAEAKAVLGGRGTASHRGAVGRRTPHDATMVLTALRHSLGDLSGADLATAHRLLARPTDTVPNPDVPEEHVYTVPEATPMCSPSICLHRVTTSSDAATDDFTNLAFNELDHVYSTEVVSMGYQAPLSDSSVASHGPDGKLDVYLEDLPEGLYGYCVPDSDSSKSSGYCVLDNDYSTSEYPTNTPLENLQVTAAHEFFHAVQFGYDSQEDTWLMEGTAAWMEDQVYNGVNDNYQYLVESPLTNPYVPIDYIGPFTDDSGTHDYSPYGSWLFFRYLSESQGAGASDDPTVVRDIWDAAVGTPYSTQAVAKALAARGTSFAAAWNTFGSWVAYPVDYFREGRGYNAVSGGTWRDTRSTFTTKSLAIKSPTGGLEVDHLTHSFNKFTAGSSLKGTWSLRVNVNMPYKARGSSARLIVKRTSGAFTVVSIPLDAKGDGTKTVGFSRSSIASVELDLVNTSTRYTCGQNAPFACLGEPVDDGNVATFSARAVK